ncbi:hypothetical protein KP509_25G020500 [Ceratopteris richardii]|uniref:Uncharacterized protein n=1 Tax=Ceratopteris richardii TaxID=49495 RepID=A0A8T2RPM9_CERRI|nr:hypothetical protein KP509_25G020500 [Ceratopteris richardii]
MSASVMLNLSMVIVGTGQWADTRQLLNQSLHSAWAIAGWNLEAGGGAQGGCYGDSTRRRSYLTASAMTCFCDPVTAAVACGDGFGFWSLLIIGGSFAAQPCPPPAS